MSMFILHHLYSKKITDICLECQLITLYSVSLLTSNSLMLIINQNFFYYNCGRIALLVTRNCVVFFLKSMIC